VLRHNVLTETVGSRTSAAVPKSTTVRRLREYFKLGAGSGGGGNGRREAFVVGVAVAVVALLNFVPVIVIICQDSNHGFEIAAQTVLNFERGGGHR